MSVQPLGHVRDSASTGNLDNFNLMTPNQQLDPHDSRSISLPTKQSMKPFKRSHTGPKRLNALGMAGALVDDGPTTPDAVDSDNEYSLVDEDGTRAQRFATDLQGNRFRELEASRIEERKTAIRLGLISDPDKPTTLEGAIEFRGTCRDMCPVFEQQEREFKKNVHPLEQREGQPGRIDPQKAVTMYHRSAAGIDQPLPSDVRDPETLKRTLDHLFHNVLNTPAPTPSSAPALPGPLASLKHTHHFLRDRTRGIRQDFTYQRSHGVQENIECHERIARFHILSIYMLGVTEERHFLKQEAEQLNKTLISLIELYEDQRLDGHDSLNEPEFRAYQLLSHLHDQEVARSILSLPARIFNHPLVQIAFDLRALAQRNFDTQKIGSKSNAEISLNFFTRYFKRVKRGDVPFLVACLAHNKLGEVRRAGVRALMRSYARVQPANIGTQGMKTKVMTMEMFRGLMGCVDDDEALGLAVTLDVTPVWEDGEVSGEGMPMGFLVSAGADYNDNADAPASAQWPEIEAKRSGASFQEIIDGKVSTAHQDKTAALRVSAPVFTPTTAFQAPEPVRTHIQPKTTMTTTATSSTGQSAFGSAAARAERTPAIVPHVGVGAPPPRQPLVMDPPSRPASAFGMQGAFGQPVSAPTLGSFSFSTGQAAPRTELKSEPVVPAAEPKPRTPVLVGPPPARPGLVQQPINAVASTSNIATPTPKAATKSRQKGPSAEQMEAMARNLASRLLFDVVNGQKEAIITEAVKHEKKRRTAELRDKDNKRVYAITSGLTRDMVDEFVEQVSGQISAEAYIEERRRLTSLHATFVSWFARGSTRRRRREIKEAKRRTFEASVSGMNLGASRVAGLDLEDQLDKSLRRSVKKRGTSSFGLDLAYRDVEDTVALLEKRAKQKAIFEEGTFFSLVGNHVCNIESDHDALDARKADVEDLGEWHVVLDVTEGASGRWLRSKFNLADMGRLEANFSGACRNAKIVATVNTDDEADWTADVGLIVFECGSDMETTQQRFGEIARKIPPRRRFQIGLLVVTWNEADCENLPKILGLQAPKPAFAWHHMVCLANDASDQAFDISLFEALPEVATVPVETFNTGGVLRAMVPHWKGLRAVASSLLNQQDLNLGLLAKVARLLLLSLTELQERIVHDLLVPLEVTTDDLPVARFATGSCPESLEFPAQLRSFLLSTVSSRGDLPESVQDGVQEWKATEDLEDRPIESTLHLVDLLAEAVQTYVSELGICIPENEVEDADRLGEDAVEHYKSDAEAIRDEITSLATSARAREKVWPAVRNISPVVASPPKPSAIERLQAALAASKPEIAAAAPLTKEHMASAILHHTYTYHSPSISKKRLASSTPDDNQTDKKAKLRRLLAAANVAMTTV